jgi:hypothetical protein
MVVLVRFFISLFGCLNFENSRTRPIPLIMILVSVGTLLRCSRGGSTRGRKWLLESLNTKKSLKETWLVKAPIVFLCLSNLWHQFCFHFFQGVPCLFDEIVMEVMWGLQNLMHFLVPEEKKEVQKGGPHPHEPRTKDGPESLWF